MQRFIGSPLLINVSISMSVYHAEQQNSGGNNFMDSHLSKGIEGGQ